MNPPLDSVPSLDPAVPRATRVLRTGMFLGAGAALAMVAIGIGHDASPAPRSLAGSGDAPASTTYAQPAVAGMKTGATATWAAPATTEEVAKAVPAIKGHG